MNGTKGIYGLTVFVCITVFMQIVYRYDLMYREQLQLFLFTTPYALETVMQPGGLSLYAARFSVQFFLLPVAGPLITALLAVAAGLLTHAVLDRINRSAINYMFGAVPVCFVIALHIDYNYNMQGTVAILFMLFALLVYTGIRRRWRRFVAGLLLIPTLYFVAGAIFSLFTLLALLWEFLKCKPRNDSVLLYIPVAALIGFLSLYAGSKGHLKFIMMPDAYYHIKLQSMTLYCLWLSFPAIILLQQLTAAFAKRLPVFRFPLAAMLAATAIVAFLLLYKQHDKRLMPEKTRQDYFLRNCMWDRIIETFNADKSDIAMMNVLNLALAQKGLLGDKMFAYGQDGHQTLICEYDRSHILAITLSDIYYHIGDIGSAQRYAMEGMTASYQYGNVRLLQRLAETNLLFGEYRAAEKYVAMLEQTLFYRTKGREYHRMLYNDNAVERDSVLGFKRKSLIHDDKYALSYSTSDLFEQLAISNPSCSLPVQYLLAMRLANREMNVFRTLLDKYYGTEILPSLGKNQQEAVMVMAMDDPASRTKYGVSRRTADRFISFSRKMEISRLLTGAEEKAEVRKEIRQLFGDTCWYYLLFTDSGKK
ncbi:MAG: DUF6057 family protein [Tannerella sp.]|jgi:hypothetical protein|nr:DUF6057 family protein [Tannerella sp.]